MRLHEIALHFLTDTREVLDFGPPHARVSSHLSLPAHIAVGEVQASDATDIGPGRVAVGMIGPDPATHTDPQSLGALLARLRPGARAVLLSGWPIEVLPYHRLLGPLGAARCQVTDVVPVEQAPLHGGVHCALVIACVDKVLPVRSYLTDLQGEQVPAGPEDEFATTLRVLNEYVLAEFVSRPLRQRLAEVETAAELRQQLTARQTQVERLEHRLAKAQASLASVESSATYQLGNTLVQGVRHPARAVVSVPKGVAQVWRTWRASRRRQPPSQTVAS
jgi:hypothetical protein